MSIPLALYALTDALGFVVQYDGWRVTGSGERTIDFEGLPITFQPTVVSGVAEEGLAVAIATVTGELGLLLICGIARGLELNLLDLSKSANVEGILEQAFKPGAFKNTSSEAIRELFPAGMIKASFKREAGFSTWQEVRHETSHLDRSGRKHDQEDDRRSPEDVQT